MKILVIGELCTDIFVYGKVDRLCPEAPVPIFNPLYELSNSGMAGNVVENLKSIRKNLDVTFWHQIEKIEKRRLIDEKSNQMIVRIDIEDINNTQSINKLFQEKESFIQECDLVIVSDYDKGFLNVDDLIQIGKLSKVSILDTKKRINEEIVNSFTFIKLNEAESLLNKDVSSKDNVIITLGKRGAKIGNRIFTQNNPKETIDVSGAGDTFVAAFGIKYLETQNMIKAIQYANELAGVVVGKRGVAVPFESKI